MIFEELIPFIDRHYPTAADTRSRVVAGFSMGGAGTVGLSIMHLELFCAAGNWGGGMQRDADSLVGATQMSAAALQRHAYAALLVHGDRDRPDADALLTGKFKEFGIAHEVVTLPDTSHNLELSFQRTGQQMMDYLGRRLSK